MCSKQFDLSSYLGTPLNILASLKKNTESFFIPGNSRILGIKQAMGATHFSVPSAFAPFDN